MSTSVKYPPPRPTPVRFFKGRVLAYVKLPRAKKLYASEVGSNKGWNYTFESYLEPAVEILRTNDHKGQEGIIGEQTDSILGALEPYTGSYLPIKCRDFSFLRPSISYFSYVRKKPLSELVSWQKQLCPTELTWRMGEGS